MGTKELIERLRRLVDDQEGGDAVVLVQRQMFNKTVGSLASQAAEIERLRDALKEAHGELFEAADKFNVIHHNHPGAAADKGIGRYQAEDKEYCAKYSDRAAQAARRASAALNGGGKP